MRWGKTGYALLPAAQRTGARGSVDPQTLDVQEIGSVSTQGILQPALENESPRTDGGQHCNRRLPALVAVFAGVCILAAKRADTAATIH